jgi:hypothetical protein
MYSNSEGKNARTRTRVRLLDQGDRCTSRVLSNAVNNQLDPTAVFPRSQFHHRLGAGAFVRVKSVLHHELACDCVKLRQEESCEICALPLIAEDRSKGGGAKPGARDLRWRGEGIFARLGPLLAEINPLKPAAFARPPAIALTNAARRILNSRGVC